MVRADKLFELHFMVCLDWHALGEQELTRYNQIDVLRLFTFFIDLLVATIVDFIKVIEEFGQQLE